MSRRTLLFLGATLLALASPARAVPSDAPPAPPAAEDGPAPTTGGGVPGGGLAVVQGVVRSLDLGAHRVTLDANGTAITLALDRNTLVYLPGGLSTVEELKPGVAVRVGRTDRLVAYWIQVAPAGAGTTPSTPGQGTGPGGGAPAPPEGSSSRSSPAPAPAPSAQPLHRTRT